MPKDDLRALRGKDVGLIVQSPRAALNPLLPIGRQIATVYRAHNKVSNRDARALACEPELIVLDEPASALAPAARTAIILLVRVLQPRLGIAYLFISHDLATVRHLSHRVAVMYLSQIVEQGDRDQIFSHPRAPYTRALLAAHLDTDPSRRGSLITTGSGGAGRKALSEAPSPPSLVKGHPELWAPLASLRILSPSRSLMRSPCRSAGTASHRSGAHGMTGSLPI